jgi:hypothetical protein
MMLKFPPALPTDPSPEDRAANYSAILSSLTENKWVVVSEGPSGAQLRHPRVMTTSTKVVLIIGVVGLLAGGAGILFLILGAADYAMTKEQNHFLNRENPSRPPPHIRKTATVTKVLLVILLLLLAAAVISNL